MNPSKTAHRVCLVSALPPGGRKIVELPGRSIGVFNVGGVYYALRNVCPHKLAPLCLGPISGAPRGDHPGYVKMERQGEIVRCPWHGWEFDITTGKSVFNPHRIRVKSYEVDVENACVDLHEASAIETYDVDVQDQFVVVYLAVSVS